MWKLYDRNTKTVDGHKHFFERWVEPESSSGMLFFSDVSPKDEKNFYNYRHPKGTVYYVVEAYGVGTIDTKKFKEKTGGCFIDRTEFEDLEQAKKFLENKQQEILILWGKKEEEDEQEEDDQLL